MSSPDIITETLTQDCLTPDTGSYGGGDTFPKSFYDSLPVSTISSPRNYESAVSEDEMTMNSPSDDTSFHTAGSLESSITEMDFSDDGEDQHVNQRFDLPPGYESQMKLEVVESYEPLLQDKEILDDSISQRLLNTRSGSSRYNDTSKIRRPSVDIPSESTPLILQNESYSEERNKKDECNDCCILL